MSDRNAAELLGRLMFQRRTELGLTITKAAARAGISTTKWSRLEKIREPQVEYRDKTLEGIAQALDTEPEVIYAIVGRPWPGHHPADRPSYEDLRAAVDDLRVRVAELEARAGDGQPVAPGGGHVG
jgi:transcriptional regulator with XRE-family HTH domain